MFLDVLDDRELQVGRVFRYPLRVRVAPKVPTRMLPQDLEEVLLVLALQGSGKKIKCSSRNGLYKVHWAKWAQTKQMQTTTTRR